MKDLIDVFMQSGAAVHLFSTSHARRGSVYRTAPVRKDSKKEGRRRRKFINADGEEESESESDEEDKKVTVSEETLARVRQRKREEKLLELEAQRRKVEDKKKQGGVQLDSWALRRIDYGAQNAAIRNQIALVTDSGMFPGKMGLTEQKKALQQEFASPLRRGTAVLCRKAAARQSWKNGKARVGQQAWKNGGGRQRHQFTSKREVRSSTSSMLYPAGRTTRQQPSPTQIQISTMKPGTRFGVVRDANTWG
jgi:hypothetical protein